MLGLPLVFIRVWAPLWFGAAAGVGAVPRADLSGKEASILGLSMVGSCLLGVFPSVVLELV